MSVKGPHQLYLTTFIAVKRSQKNILAAILALFCLGIHFLSTRPDWVDQGYSKGFFPSFSAGLRMATGIFPLSIGDLIYALAIVWIIGRLISLGKKCVDPSQRQAPHFYASWCLSVFVSLATLYIAFNVFWGLNYNRTGISKQLGMVKEKYSLEALQQVNAILLLKTNLTKEKLDSTSTSYPNKQILFQEVVRAYDKAADVYPFLEYRHPAIKSSIWGGLASYAGVSGYYNPFTGEAQVNTRMPSFLQPFVACHEVAHQLGYAKESEASFVGYLAAVSSADSRLQYSTYLDLFMSANVHLYAIDSLSAIRYRNGLSPAVQKDVQTWKDFNRRHQNPVEPFITWVYDKYLKGNEQQQGMMSYHQVTGLLLAYYKKFGTL